MSYRSEAVPGALRALSIVSASQAYDELVWMHRRYIGVHEWLELVEAELGVVTPELLEASKSWINAGGRYHERNFNHHFRSLFVATAPQGYGRRAMLRVYRRVCFRRYVSKMRRAVDRVDP
jgi:hypothetical protein